MSDETKTVSPNATLERLREMMDAANSPDEYLKCHQEAAAACRNLRGIATTYNQAALETNQLSIKAYEEYTNGLGNTQGGSGVDRNSVRGADTDNQPRVRNDEKREANQEQEGQSIQGGDTKVHTRGDPKSRREYPDINVVQD